jgi:hypothetical protein
MPDQRPPGISCRVPYVDITAHHGGFIFYPGGQLYDDPKSDVAVPGKTPGEPWAIAGLSYDSKRGKWLPAGPESMAPNGTFYVYAEDPDVPGKIRKVTIADGSSSDVTTDGGWHVVGTTDNGVYLGKIGGQDAPNPGVWFVAFGSAPTQVIDHGSWWRYFNGGLWSIDREGNLVRYDVATRSESIWAKGLPNYPFGIVGFDLSGRPIVNNNGSLAIYRVDGPMIPIWLKPNGLGATARVAADSLGVWFLVAGGLVGTPGNGVYLWTPSGGAKLIVASEVYPAGACGP